MGKLRNAEENLHPSTIINPSPRICGVPSQMQRPFLWFAGRNPWVCTHG
jgi:hypothetical protein